MRELRRVRVGRPRGRQMAGLGLVLGLALPVASVCVPASAAPGDAVMRESRATQLASEVLTVEALDNNDPPAGTTWDRSSVCIPWQGGCVKRLELDGFVKVVNDDGTITSSNPSRFGGVGGYTFRVRDSAGGTHTSTVATQTKLVSAPRDGDPDPAVRTRLRVTQVVSPTTFDRAGQVLTWTSVVRNTGNVALARLVVTDASFHVSARTCTPVPLGGTLAAGASTTCTGTMPVWQDFLDERADRTDLVTASGKATVGTVTYKASASATATSKPVTTPGLALTASATPTVVTRADQVVAYRFVARNKGNETLRDLLVRAPFPGLSALVCAPVALGGQLAPGQTTTCTADRVLGAAQLGSRTLTDTGKATARTYRERVNATATVGLGVTAPAGPTTPGSGPAPVARPDVVTTHVGQPVVVAVLANDAVGPTSPPLVGSSLRLRLDPQLPDGTVLWGDAKSLVVPEPGDSPLTPTAGGGAFLVSGRGEITFVPLGFFPAPELRVGYQVADAAGATTRSTLTVTVQP
ncbi:conserved repeat domain-containing protein [Microlunatus flavus]|uniref:Conserved repeat domain-containing protein n=1 Tax=Microlunatus flavus TaxID=1036181 RepID=A0A1H9LUQ9_9ACTN|nr:conserved repeat domain-containing protein [Microlunatus flavus]